MASSNPAKSNNRRPEWFFTKEELAKAPSIKAGLPLNKELSYRQQSANFIQDMGQHLRVTQLCINTAIVYCQRFYMFHTYQQFHRNSIALSALFLAAKVEEQPRKLEHLIKMSHICLHGRDAPPLDIRSDLYQEKAQELVTNENILLQTLGFDVAIDHPHTHVVRCCQLVKASKELAQASYYLATNSLHLTTFCCRYSPTIVACFCIHLACKWSNYKIPLSAQNKEWYVYVDEKATHDLLEELTGEFLTIYKQCPSRLKNKIKASTQAAREEEEQRRANGDTEGQFPSAPVLTTEASGSSSATDRGFTYSPTSQSSRSEVVHSRQAHPHPHPQSSHRHQQERASTGLPMGGGHRPQHVSASQSHPSSKRPTEVTSSINLEEYRKLNRQPTSSSSSDLKPVHISGSVAIHQKHHHGQTGHKHHSSSGPHQHHRHHHSQPQKTEPRSHTSQSLARPIQIPAPIPAQIIQPSFAHPPPYYPIRTSTSTTPTKRSEGNILPIGIFSTTTSTPTCFGPTPPPPPPLPPPLPPTLPPPPPPPRSTIQSPLRVDQKKVAAFKDQDLEPGEIADSPTDSKSFGVDWPKKSDERSKSGHHRIKSDPHHSSSRGSTHAKSHSSHHRDPMKISAKPYSSSFVKQELHSKPEEHLTRVNAVTQIKSEVKGLPSVQVKIESGSKSFTSATANPSSHLKTEPSSTNFKIQPGLQIKPEPGGASKLTSHKSEPRDSGDSRKEHRVHSKTSREMQTIDVKPAFNNVQVKVESVKQDPVVKTVPSVHIKLESSSKATLGTSKPEVHTTKEKSQVKTDSHNSVPKFVKPESGENLTETKRERSPSVKIEKVEGFENNHDGRKSGALVVVESDKHRDRRHKEKKKKKDKKRDRDDVDHKNGESKRHKHKHKDRSRERDSSSTMPGIKLKIKTMPPLENRAAEPPLVPIKISLASSQAESRDKKRPRPHSGLSEVAGPASKMSRALGSLVERENQFYSMVATEAERKSEQKPSKKV